jgi:lysozyme family protein
MADFVEAVNYVLANEGQLVDNRKDNGGVTNFGVTLQMLTAFRKKQCTDQDVVTLNQGEAKQLYELLFWNPLRISGLNQAVATAIFDMSVNNGQGLAVRLAQECLGPNIVADGLPGTQTFTALDKVNPEMFIYNYMGILQDRYVNICVNNPTQLVFLEGWLRRTRRLFTLLQGTPT